MKILLIENDAKQADALSRSLCKRGHDVEWAADGKSGLTLAATKNHDVIILDVLLPDMSGLNIVKFLRAEKKAVPILILSELSSVEDRVKGLNSGADDYLPKPFSLEELEARLDALYRRHTHVAVKAEIVLADLRLDLVARRAFRGVREIVLTQREFELLELFMKNPGRTFSRRTILERIWDVNYELESNIIDVFVNHLRRKIQNDKRENLIQAVRGVGYRFSVDSPPIEP